MTKRLTADQRKQLSNKWKSSDGTPFTLIERSAVDLLMAECDELEWELYNAKTLLEWCRGRFAYLNDGEGLRALEKLVFSLEETERDK